MLETKPIPYDDPDCPCHLGAGDGGVILYAKHDAGQTCVTIYHDCPWHGHTARCISKMRPGDYSIADGDK